MVSGDFVRHHFLTCFFPSHRCYFIGFKVPGLLQLSGIDKVCLMVLDLKKRKSLMPLDINFVVLGKCVLSYKNALRRVREDVSRYILYFRNEIWRNFRLLERQKRRKREWNSISWEKWRSGWQI